jgi:hypothetical protein
MKISTAAAALGGLAVIGVVVAVGFAGGQARPEALAPETSQQHTPTQVTSGPLIQPGTEKPVHVPTQTREDLERDRDVPSQVGASPVTVRPNTGAAAVPPPVVQAGDYRRPASTIPAAGDLDALAVCAAEALKIRLDPSFRPEVEQLFRDQALRQCLAYFDAR